MADRLSVRISDAGSSSFADIGLIGGGIREYVCCERPVIPLDTVEARTHSYSGATLAPWPNRLAGGSWTSAGVQYEGACNDPRGHALHGLVYNARFGIAAQTPSLITLTCRLGNDSIYPFAVQLDVAYSISECALTSVLTATNLCDERVPVALGVHPYFPYADDTTLTTSATQYFDTDGQLIPTGALVPITGLGIEPNAANRMEHLALDSCVTGLSRDGDGRAYTRLGYADGWVTEVWQDAELDYTQLFMKPDFPWAVGVSGAVGIEPQSSPANAFNSGIGLQWLEPGSSFATSWGVRVRRP